MFGKGSLELRLANNVESRHHGFLAELLNSSWGGNVTQGMMARRLNSGAFFIVAYDPPTDFDRLYLRTEHGLRELDEKIPIGILETIDIETGGDLDAVPRKYDLFTSGGDWKAPCSDSDTLILVDVTLLFSRRGRHGKGEARAMVKLAEQLARVMYHHTWSYTPDIDRVKQWHMSLGAKDTGYVIPDARPDYTYPDVNLMDYSL